MALDPYWEPYWGDDIHDLNFQQTLREIDDNVDEKWPDLAMDGLVDDLYLEMTERGPLTVAHMTSCLDTYARCLNFMQRFGDKENHRHISQVRSALEYQPCNIIIGIWETFKKMHPFTETPMQRPFCLAVQAYAKGIFNLRNEPGHNSDEFEGLNEIEGFEDIQFSEAYEWVEILYHGSRFPALIIHCWLFAETDADRKASLTAQRYIEDDGFRAILDNNGMMIQTYFSSDLGKAKCVKQFKRLLDTAGDTCIIDVVPDFLDYMGQFASRTLWDSLLTRTIHIVERLLPEPATANNHGDFESAFALPNDLIEGHSVRFGSPVLISVWILLGQHEGADLMGASAIVFARRYHRFGFNKTPTADQLSDLDHVDHEIELIGLKMFLVPILIGKFEDAKVWEDLHRTLIPFLARQMKPTWFSTLNTLRLLRTESDTNLPRYNAIPQVLDRWGVLGAAIGVHLLMDVPIGCYRAGCPKFVTETDERMRRCSACHAMQYCNTVCQNMDWEMHKPRCKLGSTA